MKNQDPSNSLYSVDSKARVFPGEDDRRLSYLHHEGSCALDHVC